VLSELGVPNAKKCSVEELRKFLKNRKTAYMAKLAPRVSADTNLASQMPALFVGIIKALKAK
jgi:hypothetical protein